MSMKENKKTKLVEAMIFISGGSISRKEIAKKVSINMNELENVITELKEYYQERGINIVDDGKQVGFFTSPVLEDELNKVEKDDLDGPLSKSARETLTTIAYCGPITKNDIDFIRGVNTQFILKRLLLRDLIQKEQNNSVIKYMVTVNFLASISVRAVEELPHYEATNVKLLDGLAEVKNMMKE